MGRLDRGEWRRRPVGRWLTLLRGDQCPFRLVERPAMPTIRGFSDYLLTAGNGAPASHAANAPTADQSRSAPPLASSVKKRSRNRPPNDSGPPSPSAAASTRRISFSPNVDEKPGGTNCSPAINPPYV